MPAKKIAAKPVRKNPRKPIIDLKNQIKKPKGAPKRALNRASVKTQESAKARVTQVLFKDEPVMPPTNVIEIDQNVSARVIAYAQKRGMTVNALIDMMIRGFDKSATVMSLDSLVSFGKYRGITLENMIRGDVRYARWAFENVAAHKFDDKAEAFLQEMETKLARSSPFRRSGYESPEDTYW